MKPAVLIGVALGVVIVAAGWLTPALLGGAQRQARQAQQQAIYAMRAAARHSVPLQSLGSYAEIGELSTAQAEAVAAAVAEQFADANSAVARQAQAAQQRLASVGLRVEAPRPLPEGAAGVSAVLRMFEALLASNAELLKTAGDAARAARDQSRDTVAVSQALGMVEYLRAQGYLVTAERARGVQRVAEGKLVRLGTAWHAAQAQVDQFRGLDVAPILSGLRADREEIHDLRSAAHAERDALTTKVASQRQELEQAERELADASRRLIELQRRGFEVGNDDAFTAYRQDYLALTARIAELQEREQELRYGGRPGATLTGDDGAPGALVGGEPVIGLEQLERELELAEARAQRFQDAHVSIEARIEQVTRVGQDAAAEVERHQRRLRELEDERAVVIAEITASATEAFEAEDAALRAARTSAEAFGAAQRAAQAWRSEVQRIQSENDPNRENQRLRAVLADPYFLQVARAAEAAARWLEGRIHAQRVESNEELLATMQRFLAVYTDARFTFDPKDIREQLVLAQQEGKQVLEQARDAYAQITQELQGQPAVWVPQGLQAAVLHALARVDVTNAPGYRQQATALIQQAVDRREQFPPLRDYVRLRDHLAGVRPTAPPDRPVPPAGDTFFD